MAAQGSSFLARLTRSPGLPAPEQVAQNLGHVLNTRKGCGSVLPELGLGDYEAAPNTHEAVIVLERELRALVLRFEPRLSDPEVVLAGRHGYRMVRFSLRGRLDGAPWTFGIDIDTSTRHVSVWLEGRG